MDLIPTSEFIKNSVVIYDEVFTDDISEEDFIITNTTPEVEEEVIEASEEIKADLLFDLPLNSYEEIKADDVTTRFELTSEILDLEVHDAQEIILEKDESLLTGGIHIIPITSNFRSFLHFKYKFGKSLILIPFF